MSKFIAALAGVTLMSLAQMAQAEIVADDACFVVSGAKRDWNGALRRLSNAEKNGHKYFFSGYNCSIFDSYGDLKQHLKTSRILKDSPILVLQIAHGGIGGTAELNKGTLSSSQVLSEIRELSKIYRVAFVSQSCYGGTMLQDKIHWEEKNPNSESIDRSCMWTTSIPGRVTYISDLLRSKDPYTFEEAYLKKPVGVVSSAAWSEVGMANLHYAQSQLPGFVITKGQADDQLNPLAENFLNGVIGVLKEGYPSLPSNLKNYTDNAMMALHPSMEDARLEAIIKSLQTTQADIQVIRAPVFDQPVSEDKCTYAVQEFVKEQWYPAFRGSTQPWLTFLKNLRAINVSSNAVSENCGDTLENKTATDWANWLAKYSPLAQHMKTFAKAHDELEKTLDKEISGYDSLVEEMTQSLVDEKIVAPMKSKREIVLSITGRLVWNAESIYSRSERGFLDWMPSPNLGKVGATGNVLPAFVSSSIVLPELDHSLDARRREACRSIELKAW